MILVLLTLCSNLDWNSFDSGWTRLIESYRYWKKVLHLCGLLGLESTHVGLDLNKYNLGCVKLFEAY